MSQEQHPYADIVSVDEVIEQGSAMSG